LGRSERVELTLTLKGEVTTRSDELPSGKEDPKGGSRTLAWGTSDLSKAIGKRKGPCREHGIEDE